MDEPKPITLTLTLKELQLLDKYVEANDDTLSVLMKIKDAYPSQKSPVEEAYKEWWGDYPPTTPSVDNYEDTRWSAFQNGYNASQKPEKEQKWDVVRESVKWCKEHPDESVEDYLTPQTEKVSNEVKKLQEKNWYVDAKTLLKSNWEPKPQTPDKIEENLREAFKKVQQTEEWKETQRKIDSNYDELVESETSPQEPTSTVFRQKLFDGIKSVFYDPEYERTHWKMKVDMAVDEVLTHFYDILPEPFEKELQDDFEKGWNSCLKSIEIYMEFGDD
jgi:hypothetical protein